jgi:hypothetical protein
MNHFRPKPHLLAMAAMALICFVGLAISGMTPPIGGGSGGGGSSGMSPREFTIVIAANDTVSATGADVQCHALASGQTDDVIINAAINSAPANATIFFRDGNYYLHAGLTTFKNGQHLLGESKPVFLTWGGGYPAFDTPGNGAKFWFDTSGVTGVTISAQRGVTLENLYFIQSNATHDGFRFDGTGILMSSDLLSIVNCDLAGWYLGIDNYGDTTRIVGNRIQEIGYCGVRTYTLDTLIKDNVFYGSNGYSVVVNAPGVMVVNNQIAQFATAGVWVNASNVLIQGNQIYDPNSASASNVILSNNGKTNSRIRVLGNEIHTSSFSDDTPAGVPNTSGYGIKVSGQDDATPLNNCLISGNIIDNRQATSTGFAIALLSGSTGNNVIGNIIPADGKYNSGSKNTIQWGTGLNRGQGTNEGDVSGYVTTTDATVTTLETITIPTNTTVTLAAKVSARRTGGASGAANDGASYVVYATFKNTSGTAALIGTPTQTAVQESQAGWDCTFDATGATARVRVTGAAANNISWQSQTTIENIAQ